MSAYIENRAHIDALVTLAKDGPADRAVSYPGDGWHMSCGASNDPDIIGRMLIAENIRSVQYRYRGEAVETLPGPCDKSSLLDYRYTRGRALTIIEGLAALDGYDYQTCECPDWRTTEAYAFVEQLRSRLIGCLPGYDEAGTWSID